MAKRSEWSVVVLQPLREHMHEFTWKGTADNRKHVVAPRTIFTYHSKAMPVILDELRYGATVSRKNTVLDSETAPP